VMSAVAARRFDAIVIDFGLPDLTGVELCRQIRGGTNAAIVVVSGSRSLADCVMSLELGADDYIRKPVTAAELAARINAILRRGRNGNGEQPEIRRIRNLQIDVEAHEVHRDGTPVSLTRSEFRLLRLLSDEPGRVVPRREIVRALWRSEYVGDERACDIHVARIRRKLERDAAHPELIITVRGVGYKLAPE